MAASSGNMVDHGGPSRVMNIAFIAVASVLFINRVYVRLVMLKNWGADDFAATAALALLLTLSYFEIQEVAHGAGKHLINVPAADAEIFFKNLPTMQLIFMATSYMVKLSILLFLRRLHQGVVYLRVVWATITGLTIQAVVIMLIFAFECKPVIALWDKTIVGAVCISAVTQAKLFYAHAALGIISDFICLALPMFIVWKLLMFEDMKLRLTSVFGIGIFAVIAGIIRFCIIVTVDMGIDTTFNIVRASIWTDIEVYIGFFVSCFPSLAPYFRFVARKVTGVTSSSKRSKNQTTNNIPLYSVSQGADSQSIAIGQHDKFNPKGSFGGDLEAGAHEVILPTRTNGDMYGRNMDFKVHIEKEVNRYEV